MVAEGVAEAVVILLGTVAVPAAVAVDLVAAGATVPAVVEVVKVGMVPVIGAVNLMTLLLQVGVLRDHLVQATTKMRMITTMTHRETVVEIDALIPDPSIPVVRRSSRGKVMELLSLGRRLTP